MAIPCPVCGSEDTGGYPKRHKNYTERGRLDIDDWTCLGCGTRWEIWDYVREGVSENKDVRLKDGRVWIDGVIKGEAVACRECSSVNVKLVSKDGIWRGQYNVQQLRYECDDCGALWLNMTCDDGTIKMWRLRRHGRSFQR